MEPNSENGKRPFPLLLIGALVLIVATSSYVFVQTNRTCAGVPKPPHPKPLIKKGMFDKADSKHVSDETRYVGDWECRNGQWQIETSGMFGGGYQTYKE